MIEKIPHLCHPNFSRCPARIVIAYDGLLVIQADSFPAHMIQEIWYLFANFVRYRALDYFLGIGNPLSSSLAPATSPA